MKKDERDNALSVTTSQCGPYLRGISTSISRGYHGVKSAGSAGKATMRGRVKSRKLQTSRCLCRDKKILGSPPSPPPLCYLSFRHFRGAGAEKAVLFAWTVNGRRRSVVAGIARVPSRRFSPVRENEMRLVSRQNRMFPSSPREEIRHIRRSRRVTP